MKIAGKWLVLALLGTFLLPFAVLAQNQDPASVLPEEWKKLSVAEKFQELNDIVIQWRTYVGHLGVGKLREDVAQYPFTGVGISFGTSLDEEGNLVQVVSAVWINSPAFHAGIMRGDVLADINNHPVCKIRASQDDSPEVLAAKTKTATVCGVQAKKFIAEAPDQFTLKVQRGSSENKFTLSKALVGSEVAKFAAVLLSAWEKSMQNTQELVDALLDKAMESRGNSAKLDACYLEFVDSSEQIFRPWNELSTEAVSHQTNGKRSK